MCDDPGLVIGKICGRRKRLRVYRNRLMSPHWVVLGINGSGKSTLIESVISQIIENGVIQRYLLDDRAIGDGLSVIDPAGDLSENIGARRYSDFLSTGDKSVLAKTHILEPGRYDISFGLDPARFDPAKAIHPEHRKNAHAAWKHATIGEWGDFMRLKQGATDFEQTPRLQRIHTRASSGTFQDVGGIHLPIPFAMYLLDPDLPRSEEIVEKLAPLLDAPTLADIHRIRGYRRVEDRLREIESFLNNFNAVICSPQAKAIFSSRIIVPFRKIMLAGGTILWNLRPTEYFNNDAKTTFGKYAQYVEIKTMMSMPRELRKRRTLIIDESSEFANEFLLWSLGAARKAGKPFSIILIAQDLSSFVKKDLDMRPKVLSQSNIITFQQQLPEDVEFLTRIMRSGELAFEELELDVERHDTGHEWIPVQETSESLQVSANESETNAVQETETDSEQETHGNGKTKNRSKTKTRSSHVGKVDTRSRPEFGNERPSQISHADSNVVGGAEGEAEGEADQETSTLGKGKSKSKGKSKAKQTGATLGTGLSVSNKKIPLPKPPRIVKQPTGKLKKAINDQREKQMQEMMGLKKRYAYVKIVGRKKAVKIKTLKVEPAFPDPVMQIRAYELFCRELFERHSYYFVPNFDPSEDAKQIREFLDHVAGQNVEPDEIVNELPAGNENRNTNGRPHNGDQDVYGY